jgi:hypothetical protein
LDCHHTNMADVSGAELPAGVVDGESERSMTASFREPIGVTRLKGTPNLWFTDPIARWRPTETSGVEDVTRWAFDDDDRIWMTTVSTHSSAEPDADPVERRLYPGLLLENAVQAVRDTSDQDPFPWDVADVIANPGPPEDYLPILGRGRMVVNGRLYLGTTVQVDSSIFVASVVDGLWVGALQPRGRHHPKLNLEFSAA